MTLLLSINLLWRTLKTIAINQLSQLSQRIYRDVSIEIIFDNSVIDHISKVGRTMSMALDRLKGKFRLRSKMSYQD